MHEFWLVPVQDAGILDLDFHRAARAVLNLGKEMLGLERGRLKLAAGSSEAEAET